MKISDSVSPAFGEIVNLTRHHRLRWLQIYGLLVGGGPQRSFQAWLYDCLSHPLQVRRLVLNLIGGDVRLLNWDILSQHLLPSQFVLLKELSFEQAAPCDAESLAFVREKLQGFPGLAVYVDLDR